MKGFTFKRCACTDPETGKPVGQGCPQLSDNRRHHGSYFWSARLDTSRGRKVVKRGGFEKEREAQAALDTVKELAALATDDRTRAQIGDMIVKATMRGGKLPAVEDVKRRLGLGAAPGEAGVTFGEAWAAWLAGKKRLRLSAAERLAQIGVHWLLPVLADVPLERLNGGHCSMVFERVEWISAEIIRQRGDGRAWIHVGDCAEFRGDVRSRPRPVGIASQHRIYAALREFCNFEVRKTRRLAFNPVYAVELLPEERPEAQRWSPQQAARFLAFTAGDPLHLLFRIVLLRGARRGEACGFRWAGTDLDAGVLTVERPRLLVGAAVIDGRPKTSGSARKIYLDAVSAELLRAHRRAHLAARMRAGEAWQDDDLVFCREDGTGYRPDYVYRRFQRLAKDAGLPVIKLHEGRHTAASLARDAGVDRNVRQEQLGHADAAMTDHYTHVLAESHRAAAEQVADLVAKAAGS